MASGFGDTGAAWLRLGLMAGRPFLRSAESGARTVVYLAASPDVAARTGGYYVNSKRRNPSRTARDAVLAHRLWDISARLTGLTAPTVTQ